MLKKNEIKEPKKRTKMKNESKKQQIFIQEISYNFNLREPKGNKPTLIYLVLKHGTKQYKLSTFVKVYPKQWDKTEQCAKMGRHYTELDLRNNTIANEAIMTFSDNVDKLKSYLCNHVDEIDNFDELLKQYVYYNNTTTEKAKRMKKKISATAALKLIIAENINIKDSSKLQQVRNIDKFSRWLKDNKIEDSFTNMNLATIVKYQNFLAETNSPISVKNAIKSTLISLLKRASIHDEYQYDWAASKLDNWQRPKKKANKELADKKYITFSDSDIERIYNYNITVDDKLSNGKKILPKHAVLLNEIKDLFVLQCEVGQRISDMTKVFCGKIQTIGDVETITIVQKKTNNTAIIPLSTRAKAIINKYKDNAEAVNYYEHQSRINRYIKEVIEIVGFDENITYQDDNGNIITSPKWQLTHSHVARHSFITNMLRKGMSKDVLKNITGHSDTQMIDNIYSHLTNEDNANNIVRELNKKGILCEKKEPKEQPTTPLNEYQKQQAELFKQLLTDRVSDYEFKKESIETAKANGIDDVAELRKEVAKREREREDTRQTIEKLKKDYKIN